MQWGIQDTVSGDTLLATKLNGVVTTDHNDQDDVFGLLDPDILFENERFIWKNLGMSKLRE